MHVMLQQFFFETAVRLPDAPALHVNEATLTYAELAHKAARVATRISGMPASSGSQPSCLLFASRSVEAYSGLLGILAAGMAYVPLNPKFPMERNAAIVKRSGSRTILVDRRCREQFEALLAMIDEPLHVLFLDADEDTKPLAVPATQPQELAYILFTSGTTGVPKGVCISHASAVSFIENQLQFYPPVPHARYSQNFDLTFDPSVHDMFVCWGNGGCLYVPEVLDALYLVDFIKENRLTHWASVPSIGSLMRQMRKLSDNAFPSLRISMFGGEALTADQARAWLRAAPAGRLFNAYGPTEATVSCLRFEVTNAFLDTTDLAVMPLGATWPGQEMIVVDENLAPVAPGEPGELIIGGSQLATKYLTDNASDHDKFFTRHYPGRSAGRWYRSGDVARESAQDGLLFQGRIDTQIKLFGNRIELQEVERVVQRCGAAELACVVAWPFNATGAAQGIVAFLLNPRMEEQRILADCKRYLPIYALPARIVALDAFPLNVNGKVDRKQLTALLG